MMGREQDNGARFSTRDFDQDTHPSFCSQLYKGVGGTQIAIIQIPTVFI